MLRPEEVCKVCLIPELPDRVLLLFRQAVLASTTLMRF